MKIRLSFKRMFLDPGKTFAVPAVAGARVRVLDGMVWATTSNSPDDVWLGAGDEHTVQSSGLTVVESVTRSTVELVPPAATGWRRRISNRYEIAIPRAACQIAAIAMTVITFGLLVVLPAKMASGSQEARASLASSTVTGAPAGFAGSQPRGSVKPLEHPITQASSSAALPTSVQ
jgi:Protein of unknown function (DUF2917)